ncbi:MAG: MFS transporter, partial [Hydrogenovibrio sp.]|nr:MFS transporter [Hydrogenovibrio sp.]
AIISVYGMIWGGGQLITGPLSDRIGRKPLIVWGMGLCGLGVLLIPYTDTALLWTLEAGAIGIGMAMLYPNLGAAVGDVAPVRHRASIIGIYRFWRDSGYAFGALVMGLIAQWGDNLVLPFWFVGIAMMLSGGYVSVALKSKN